MNERERDDCLEMARHYVMAPGDRSVTVHGYASKEGALSFNTSLAERRAERVKALLIERGVPEARIHAIGHGPDTTYPGRAANRRAELAFAETMDFPAETITVPKFKCGPDVTAQVSQATGTARTAFAAWSVDQRTEACEDLRSVTHGNYAWDIVELHNNAWILGYRPLCATQGATPPCGSTVQVSDQCYYAGSPNYVIFGVMCAECYRHFLSIGRAGSMPGYTGYMDFTESEMVDLMDLYKPSSGNTAASKAWARAGYEGWPSGGSPPSGDRAGCAPQCSLPYTGPDFRVNWYPFMFHTGGGDR